MSLRMVAIGTITGGGKRSLERKESVPERLCRGVLHLHRTVLGVETLARSLGTVQQGDNKRYGGGTNGEKRKGLW